MKSEVQEANSHEAQLEYGILYRFSRAPSSFDQLLRTDPSISFSQMSYMVLRFTVLAIV